MQLDIYLPELKLAFEHQGEQHFTYIKYFHSSNGDIFKKSIKRDKEKQMLCKKQGIKLLYTDYTWDGRYKPIVDLLKKHSVLPHFTVEICNED